MGRHPWYRALTGALVRAQRWQGFRMPVWLAWLSPSTWSAWPGVLPLTRSEHRLRDVGGLFAGGTSPLLTTPMVLLTVGCDRPPGVPGRSLGKGGGLAGHPTRGRPGDRVRPADSVADAAVGQEGVAPFISSGSEPVNPRSSRHSRCRPAGCSAWCFSPARSGPLFNSEAIVRAGESMQGKHARRGAVRGPAARRRGRTSAFICPERDSTRLWPGAEDGGGHRSSRRIHRDPASGTEGQAREEDLPAAHSDSPIEVFVTGTPRRCSSRALTDELPDDLFSRGEPAQLHRPDQPRFFNWESRPAGGLDATARSGG